MDGLGQRHAETELSSARSRFSYTPHRDTEDPDLDHTKPKPGYRG